MSGERIKRPKLIRTHAIRSWSTLFEAPGTTATGGQASAEPGRAASMDNVVSRSVELGYRVIDEYIREGQKAAQRLGERSYGAAAITNDASELVARMAQYASEYTAVWFDFLQASGAGMMTPPPMPPSNVARASTTSPPAPPSAATTASASGSVHLKVAVLSPYPAEVSLDLRKEAANGRITVQSLRAVEADKPRLSDVAVEDSRGGMTLRIRVPEGQPAGIYTGLIVDEGTSRPVGTVSLRIMRE